MPIPSFLANRPLEEAENAVNSTCVIVLGAFLESGAITTTELEYGFEDLPMLATVAGLMRDEVAAWHRTRGTGMDFRILQKGFVECVRIGLDVAAQIEQRIGEALRVDADLSGLLEDSRTVSVRPPLDTVVQGISAKARDVFVDFQNKQLAIAAGTKNELLANDIFACGCMWAALAGVEAGLTLLDPPMAA